MFTIDDLRQKKKATYSYEDIEFYAKQYSEGTTYGIPDDFDLFLVDKKPKNADEIALWIYVCLTRNGLVGHFSRRANPRQPDHSSHIEFISDAFFEEVTDCIVLGNRKGAKCLGRGTPVMMYDGKIKSVEQVEVGDLLMGDDSTPRTVLSTASGYGEMYKVIPEQGEPYTVNDVHILSLMEDSVVLDVPLNEYLLFDEKRKEKLKGYKVPVDAFGGERNIRTFCVPPYVFGTCLLNEEMYIPYQYKTASLESRLQLLCGIINTNSGSHFIMSSKRLAEDIIFVARSVGLTAHLEVSTPLNKDIGEIEENPVQYQFTIAGDMQTRNTTLVGIKEIEPLGLGEYFGFEIDGNRRFLLGDFTVTHNTLVFATLLLLEALFKPEIELAHLGAIKDQAIRCYRYFLKILNHPLFANVTSKPPTATRTEFRNGSVVEILTGTVTGVNSPHPVKAQLDEVELMDWHVLQEALNMAASMKGYVASTRLTSTRKYSTGTMQKIIDEADAKGFRIYKWNLWDTVEPCKIAKGLESIEIAIEDEDGHEQFYYVSAECTTCSLLKDCRGRARYSSGGIIPLADAMKLNKSLDAEVWQAQVECSKPGTSDLWFPMFNEKYHVIDYEAWLKDRDCDITKDYETEGMVSFNTDLPVYAGQDAGFNCPAAVFGQLVDEEVVIIFDESYEHNIAPSVLIKEHLLQKEADYLPDQWFCDPSGLQLMAEMEIHGLMVAKADNTVYAGIELLQSLFSTGRLFIDRRCVNLIQELKTYRKTKTNRVAPNQEDHAVDSLRYLTMSLGLFSGMLEAVTTGVGREEKNGPNK